MQTAFDPLAPEVIADPYEFLGTLRRDQPVVYCPSIDMWLITRHGEIGPLPGSAREVIGIEDAHLYVDRATYVAALRRHSTHTVVPRAALRVYGGGADEIAPSTDARAAVAAMRAAGGNVRFVDLGALDHVDAALAAVPPIRAWFDALTDPR